MVGLDVSIDATLLFANHSTTMCAPIITNSAPTTSFVREGTVEDDVRELPALRGEHLDVTFFHSITGMHLTPTVFKCFTQRNIQHGDPRLLSGP